MSTRKEEKSSDNNNNKEEKDDNQDDVYDFMDAIFDGVRFALLSNSGSDLDSIGGMNELSFKTTIMGVVSAIRRKYSVISIRSEVRVKKKDNSMGIVDLIIDTEYATIVLELKYISLVYARDIEPKFLNTGDYVKRYKALEKRRDNFIELEKEYQLSKTFQINDSGRKIRETLTKEKKSFSTVPSSDVLIIIEGRRMIDCAKSQITEYQIEGARKFVIVGIGPSVFIEEVPNDTQ